jgi:Cu-processing system permease protein
VLVYDLLLLGILVLSQKRFSLSFFPVLLYLNPADIFRILNVFGFEDVRKLYGLATVLPATLASPWALGSAMVMWIVAPLGIAVWRFK